MMETGGSGSQREIGKCCSEDLKDGGRSLETRNPDGFHKLEKAREDILPCSLLKQGSCVFLKEQHLIIAH